VYLSGVEEKPVVPVDPKKFKRGSEAQPSVADVNENVEFTLRDLENLINVCEKRNEGDCIDILLTNQWPKFIERLNNQPLVRLLR
jgi:hypothetical protein